MDPQPVPVHVVSAAVPLGAKTPAPPEFRVVYSTAVLSSDDPAQNILPASPDRVSALVQALDDDIVIAGNLAEARNANGTVVPKANTAPYPVTDTGPVYAGVVAALTGTETARVAISATYRKAASCNCR